jgi:hypothetical protein
MDNIHHGLNPAQHELVTRPVVLDDADRVLCDFKTLIEEEYPNVSSVYEGAKNLWEQDKYHWTQGKKRVLKGDWNADDFDADMLDLFQRQEVIWDRLMGAGAELLIKIETSFEKVLRAEAAVKHERGEGANIGWMALPTAEQELIRKTYYHNLRFNFKDAKVEHDNLCGYPDGLLTRMRLLHERADKETAELHDGLKQKEHHTPLIDTPAAVLL